MCGIERERSVWVMKTPTIMDLPAIMVRRVLIKLKIGSHQTLKKEMEACSYALDYNILTKGGASFLGPTRDRYMYSFPTASLLSSSELSLITSTTI